MENDHVLIISVNKTENDVYKVLSGIHLKILGEYHDTRGNISISINNDDWLWLLDRWVVFYLSGTYRTSPEISWWERFMIRLGLQKPSITPDVFVADKEVKRIRNEMSDGKYLFVNGRKVKVRVT